ncbi:MAG: hypothetical protein ABIG46_05675 [Candidatus Omnitrophota bacterium]|nr:hypothetical protein [Candidatus Omnitrophota bacterium]
MVQLFFEDSAAAQSLKNSWTRMASTITCMQVKVSPEAITIKPRSSMAWLMDLLCLDLNHVIPIPDIKTILPQGQWSKYGKVEVTFVSGGQEKKVLLYLKNDRQFIDAVNSLMKKGSS